MEARCDLYIEHDGDGSRDTFGGPWMPARIRRPKFEPREMFGGFAREVCVDDDFREGHMNLMAHHFEGKSGSAYQYGTGQGGTGQGGTTEIIVLHVHSNLCYSLRFKGKQQSGQQKEVTNNGNQ